MAIIKEELSFNIEKRHMQWVTMVEKKTTLRKRKTNRTLLNCQSKVIFSFVVNFLFNTKWHIMLTIGMKKSMGWQFWLTCEMVTMLKWNETIWGKYLTWPTMNGIILETVFLFKANGFLRKPYVYSKYTKILLECTESKSSLVWLSLKNASRK